MKLVAFRVRDYRNIKDSGWIELDRVTALVGRNESGKTTLLKALHKFNPATKEPYDPQREFPRDRYTSEFSKYRWRVCEARFELEGAISDTLLGILPEGCAVPKFAEVVRFYDDRLTVAFNPPLSIAEVTAAPVLAAITTLEKAARRLKASTPEDNQATVAAKTALLTWATNAREALSDVGDLRGDTGVALLQRLRTELNALSDAATADPVEAFLEILDRQITEAKEPDPAQAARTAVVKCLPVFIYFENYGVLDSAVWLTRFLQDAKADPTNPKIRTIKAMFSHVGLSAEDLQKLGTDLVAKARQVGQPVSDEMLGSEQRRREERSIKLSSASSAITRLFGEWWSQRRHKIRYDADGDFFRIWVADNRRPDVEIELESRSKGFQWFLSFYLVFLVESEDGHKDAVLLLDEPGLNLHPTAQQELLAFFEKLSGDNQILYSTHSPFLVDGDNLQRVRPVVEGDDGHSRISAPGMWPKDRETIFPLQAAAGYAMVRGLLSMHRNVLVEGMTDFYLLHAISHRCRGLGLPHLPDDVHLVPCGGVPMVGKIASLFLGEGPRPVVLLDGDQAGRGARTTLLRDLYRGVESAVLLLDDVLDGEGNEVEDLLGDDLFVSMVNESLRLTLTVLPAAPGAAGSVIKRTMAAAAAAGVDLPDGWKVTTALHLVRSWAEGRTECPEEVARRGAAVFKELLDRMKAGG